MEQLQTLLVEKVLHRCSFAVCGVLPGDSEETVVDSTKFTVYSNFFIPAAPCCGKQREHKPMTREKPFAERSATASALLSKIMKTIIVYAEKFSKPQISGPLPSGNGGTSFPNFSNSHPQPSVLVANGGEQASAQHVRAFPTEGRMRQKEKEKQRKEAGLEPVVRKKKFVVEDHFDDCGQDLSGLGKEVQAMVVDYLIETADDIAEEDLFDEHSVHDPIEHYDMQEVCAYYEQTSDLCMRFMKGSDAHLLWSSWQEGSDRFNVDTRCTNSCTPSTTLKRSLPSCQFDQRRCASLPFMYRIHKSEVCS